MHNRSKRKETAAPFVSKQKLSTARLFNSFQPVSTRQVQDRRRGQRPTFVRNATHRCTGYQRCGSEPQRSFAVKAKSCTCSLKRDDRLSPPLRSVNEQPISFLSSPSFFFPQLSARAARLLFEGTNENTYEFVGNGQVHTRGCISGEHKRQQGG